jgi:carboxyl-terminal processing protease
VITSSKYIPVANLEKIRNQLNAQHQKRMKTSAEYKYLQEDIAQAAKRQSETSITLNEAQLKKERTEQDAKNLARENQRRALRGLPPLKKGETPNNKDVLDFIQDESLSIMGDFIELNKDNKVTMTY